LGGAGGQVHKLEGLNGLNDAFQVRQVHVCMRHWHWHWQGTIADTMPNTMQLVGYVAAATKAGKGATVKKNRDGTGPFGIDDMLVYSSVSAAPDCWRALPDVAASSNTWRHACPPTHSMHAPHPFHACASSLPMQDPLPAPLLKHSTDNASRAMQMFGSILAYMGDSAEKLTDAQRVEMVQKLLHQGLKRPELKDELYMQLVKQTRGNSVSESRMRAWELMFLIASTMPPSKVGRALGRTGRDGAGRRERVGGQTGCGAGRRAPPHAGAATRRSTLLQLGGHVLQFQRAQRSATARLCRSGLVGWWVGRDLPGAQSNLIPLPGLPVHADA
jgi:Trp operon repressor